MYKFLVEKEEQGDLQIEKQFFHFADNSIYLLIKYYKDGDVVNQLFVKVLQNIKDYKQFFNNFYITKSVLMFDPVQVKASNSMDIFSLETAKHTYALTLTAKEYLVLAKEAKRNGFK